MYIILQCHVTLIIRSMNLMMSTYFTGSLRVEVTPVVIPWWCGWLEGLAAPVCWGCLWRMGHFLLPKMTPNQHSTHTVSSLQLHDIDIAHVANDFPTHCLGWNSFANILFIDQPAGTGFSYFTNPDGYDQEWNNHRNGALEHDAQVLWTLPKVCQSRLVHFWRKLW